MDAMIDTAFRNGGLALAFVMVLWAYRDLWQRRLEEMKGRAEEAENDRDVVLRALTDAREVNTRLTEKLSAMGTQVTELTQAVKQVHTDFSTHRGIMEQSPTNPSARTRK